MARVEDSFIQLNLYCRKCGHEWYTKDYFEIDVLIIIDEAVDIPCPNCGAK